MTEPTAAQALAEVEEDVRAGLGAVIDPIELTIEFDDDPVFVAGVRFAVAWTVRGINSKPLVGYEEPTNRPVVIEGVSILEHDGTRWQHRRYVDWNGFIGQLGGSRGRPSQASVKA
jgi:hypothetical protein